MKRIPGLLEYYATPEGDIYSVNGRKTSDKAPQKLKPFKTTYGRTVVKITLPCGSKIFCSVQRLIALAFLKEPLTKYAEAHLKDKTKPPSADNVYWRENKNELEQIKARQIKAEDLV